MRRPNRPELGTMFAEDTLEIPFHPLRDIAAELPKALREMFQKGWSGVLQRGLPSHCYVFSPAEKTTIYRSPFERVPLSFLVRLAMRVWVESVLHPCEKPINETRLEELAYRVRGRRPCFGQNFMTATQALQLVIARGAEQLEAELSVDLLAGGVDE